MFVAILAIAHSYLGGSEGMLLQKSSLASEAGNFLADLDNLWIVMSNELVLWAQASCFQSDPQFST